MRTSGDPAPDGTAALPNAPISSATPTSAADVASLPSLDDLLPQLYQQLRRIAHGQLGRRPNGGTLETGELVHEAYLKFVGSRGAPPLDRARFLSLAAVAMRQVLVDRAKAHSRLKRGGGGARITLDEERIAVADRPEAVLQLDEALSWLAGLAPRLARVVECRFFGGMSEEEVAQALDVTVRTVQRDWAKARMLLREALES